MICDVGCAFEMEIRIFYHICDEALCAETVIRNYHLILGKSYGSIIFNKVHISVLWPPELARE